MKLKTLLSQLRVAAEENAPEILTGIGVAGVLTTAYLTGKAAVLSYERIQSLEYREDRQADSREIFHETWDLYIPPVISAVFTIGCIVGSNRISNNRLAAIATAYSITDRAYTEYREKVVEKVGEKKEQAFRDEIAQDRVDKNPHDTSVVIAEGKVLCYDQHSGRYFTSTMQTIRKAENDINYQIMHDGYASLSDLYFELGLDVTRYSEEVGWNTDTPLRISYSTVMAPDDRPAIAIDFDLSPKRKYSRLVP